MSHRLGLGLLAAVVTSLVPVAAAEAAPVTANLRVEGPQGTVFQGDVTTDVAPFRFTAGADTATQYRCDDADGSVTRGALLSVAAQQRGFPIAGTFSTQFGSPTFDSVGGQSVAYDAATGKYLAEYEDGVAAQVGSCADPITSGSRVVFAYGTGAPPEFVLRLTQTAVALAPNGSTRVTYRVTDDATGAPVAGASVSPFNSAGGTPLVNGAGATDANGTITGDAPAGRPIQASKDGAIRSNSFITPMLQAPGTPTAPSTPVTPTAPATTPDTTPAVGRVTSLRTGQSFRRGTGPRVLSGTATDDRGVTEVRIRLSRSGGAGCARFDGARERFVRTRRCSITTARTFRVSTSAAWEYQLPSRLGPGRYVLDVLARDASGNRLKTTQLQRGTSRVVFTVR